MYILVVYYSEFETISRSTTIEHLGSFRKYSGEKCFYLNAASGVPSYLSGMKFDLIIFHYTICACKWSPAKFMSLQRKWAPLKRVSGYKIALPQDEYVYSEDACLFFREFGVRTIFTCLPSTEWQKVYSSEKSGIIDFVTVFTGYVDDDAIENIKRISSPSRDIDIGYRARNVPYWLGSHGCIKWRLAEVFRDAVKKRNLKIDISNDPRDFYGGDDWYRFLSRCRVVLGCEGGASLHDPAGDIRERVEEYVALNPGVSFEEVEKMCFPGLDGNLSLRALSPRHFECCITKTCQALVEGEYAGIFKAGVHFIEIKKDWSNIEEVLDKIADKEYCKTIADKAYDDIVASGLYTYRGFVYSVIEHCRPLLDRSIYKDEARQEWLRKRLKLRELSDKPISIGLASGRRIFHKISAKLMAFFPRSQLQNNCGGQKK